MDGAFPSQGSGSFAGGRGRGFRGTAENSKTKLCTRWMEGDCRFGDRCNFAHGEQELRKIGEGCTYDRGGYGMGRGGGYGGRGEGYGGRGGAGYGGRGGPEEQYGGYGGGPQGFKGGGYGGPSGGMDHGLAPPGMSQESWASQGYPTVGPNGWYMYRAKDTHDPYFHNHLTNVTTWERPADWPAGPGEAGM